MSLFLLSLLIFSTRILLGALMAHLLWKDSRPAALALKLLAGIPLGLGVCSAAMLFALRLGIAPSVYAPLELAVSLLAGVLLLIKLWPLLPHRISLPRADWPLIALLLAGLTLGAGTFLLYLFRHPHGFGDAWTIWNNLPRYLYRSDDPGLLFRPADYARLHPDYPALSSLSIASLWALIRSDTTRAPMALAFLTILALPLTLFAGLTFSRRGKWLAGFAALVMAMTPQLAITIGQGVDALVALTFLLAGIFLHLYRQKPTPGLLALAGLLAGFSAWIKNEGLLFALLMLLPVFWCIRRANALPPHPGPPPLGEGRGEGLALLPPLFVVFFFKASVAAQSDLARPLSETLTRLLDGARYGTIAFNTLREFFQFGHWPISQTLILTLFVLWRKVTPGAWRAAWPLWALIILQQAGYFFIYLITPHDLQLHLDTSLVRLLFQTYPLTLYALFSLLTPLEQNSSC